GPWRWRALGVRHGETLLEGGSRGGDALERGNRLADPSSRGAALEDQPPVTLASFAIDEHSSAHAWGGKGEQLEERRAGLLLDVRKKCVEESGRAFEVLVLGPERECGDEPAQ